MGALASKGKIAGGFFSASLRAGQDFSWFGGWWWDRDAGKQRAGQTMGEWRVTGKTAGDNAGRAWPDLGRKPEWKITRLLPCTGCVCGACSRPGLGLWGRCSTDGDVGHRVPASTCGAAQSSTAMGNPLLPHRLGHRAPNWQQWMVPGSWHRWAPSHCGRASTSQTSCPSRMSAQPARVTFPIWDEAAGNPRQPHMGAITCCHMHAENAAGTILGTG